MKKRILSLLLCLVLCLSLMPMSAFAADTAYDVWVNGEQFTSDNLSITCGSGTAVYDPAKGELTLNNATITNVHSDDSINAAVYSGETLTVVLKGSNTVSPASSVDACGFYSDSGDLTLTGSGDVDIKSYDAGIYANAGNITLSNSGSVNIHSEYYECIYASDGDVVISGSGDVTIEAENDDGIYADKNVTVSGDGDLTVKSHYYGIYADDGDVVISGSGDVTIEAEDDDGIYADKNVTVSGDGDLTVTSNEDGINAYYSDITISGNGDRTFYTTNTDYNAVLAEYGDIDVSGTGALTIASAPGSSSSEYYVGLYAFKGSLSVSGSVVLNISDTEYGTYSSEATTFASEGEMTVDASVWGVSSSDDIIFSGSGKATINADEYGAYLYNTGKSVLLNGIGTPISLTGGTDCSAVYNNADSSSPVGGTNFANYDVTGAPNEQSVVYTLKCSHTPVTITGKVATCTEDGWKDYYECSLCHKYFEDNACEAEIADLDVWKEAGGNGYIAPKGHTYGEWATTKEPTLTEKGMKERSCTACGDKQTEEIPVLTPATYSIISGANGEWTKGSTTGLAFTSDAPFDKYDSVKIDGTVIAAANYTAEAGSTKITLAPAYLETLSVGTHSIEIVSNDGSASTNFTIKAAASTDPTNPTSPQTGDTSDMFLWIALLLVSGGALVGTTVYGKKRKRAE